MPFVGILVGVAVDALVGAFDGGRVVGLAVVGLTVVGNAVLCFNIAAKIGGLEFKQKN